MSSTRAVTGQSETAPVLDVRGLRTWFHTRGGVVKAVDEVSFSLNKGEVLGLVGESGCGKSVTSLSVMGLVPKPGKVESGQVLFNGRDLLSMKSRSSRNYVARGSR